MGSRSGHKPGFRARSPVGGARGNPSIFSLSPSLPVSLKIKKNKMFKKRIAWDFNHTQCGGSMGGLSPCWGETLRSLSNSVLVIPPPLNFLLPLHASPCILACASGVHVAVSAPAWVAIFTLPLPQEFLLVSSTELIRFQWKPSSRSCVTGPTARAPARLLPGSMWPAS